MSDWPRDWRDLRVGFTTSIPVEVLLAAGAVPVDLNNRFITSPDPAALVAQAEQAGLPRTVCGWVKGIYATALASDDLAAIVAVTQGDCSNTHALIELFQYQGRRVITFAYPYDRCQATLAAEVDKLLRVFGVTYDQVHATKRRLDGIRRMLLRLDELTWKEGKVSGEENHRYLVSASDFAGDPELFAREVATFLQQVEARPRGREGLRLGYLGVPPIWSDFYSVIEGSASTGAPDEDLRWGPGRACQPGPQHGRAGPPFGGRPLRGHGAPALRAGTRPAVPRSFLGGRFPASHVVLNEMQRQFAMLPAVEGGAEAGASRPDNALLDQYLRYTYPYDVFARIEDVKREARRRRLHGLIHYVQSFCFRQIEDLLIRREVGLPMLTLEGDRPGPVDAPTRTRIESFMEMLMQAQGREPGEA
jgi:benzoyl-CoA reductase/2-hydroxyglutaryl-CoA dehydratase subunit BcrC/BadD/HgdB